MKTTIQFEMKGNDVRLLSEIREPVRIVAGDISVEGLVAPKTWFSWNEIECDVLEKEGGISNITIPVKSLKVSRDWSDEIQVVYGIGDPYPTYITAADRRRYRELEGLRAYRKTLVACTYAFEAEEDWPNEYMGHTVCGHSPENHGPDGCNEILDYYDWDCPVYCPCEGYQKPAPLMRIT